MSTVITSVDHRSPAQRAGVRPGEKLLTINGHEIVDVLDYRFYGYDAKCRLELLEPNGSVRNVQIKKEEGLDLGLNFDTYLMDEMRCCANHCVFCFVDQMPPGMRQTLYFKDDDARLSFLQGNYITLTNLTEREAQRIIDLRISPINVSVHTTDPQLHCTMLGNKNAVRSLEYMRRFCEAGIVMNGQIVICPGWNDGDQLRRTLRDLTEMEFSSCSLVPVGITKYRKGLAKLRPVDAATAAEMAAAAADGLRTGGILPTLKHFPGHGDTAEDSHTALAVTYKTLDELQACELLPFAADTGLHAVMVGHIAAPNVTGDGTPATLSPQLVALIPDAENTLIVTDSLAMDAITAAYTPGEAAVQALQAGCDVLLMPNSLPEAYAAVLEAVQNGTISEERLDRSVNKILLYKQQFAS